MLRAEYHDSEKGVMIRLEGLLVAEFAEAVKQSVLLRGNVKRGLVTDLTEVFFIDALGEDVLTWLKGIGSTFLADTSYSLHLCDRLQLPLAPKAPTKVEKTGIVPK